MSNKLDKIAQDIEEIKNSNGYLILIFLCFISLCTTCNYVKEMAEEQHKTNIYLKLDYNEKQSDTLSTFTQPKSSTKKSKNKQ